MQCCKIRMPRCNRHVPVSAPCRSRPELKRGPGAAPPVDRPGRPGLARDEGLGSDTKPVEPRPNFNETQHTLSSSSSLLSLPSSLLWPELGSELEARFQGQHGLVEGLGRCLRRALSARRLSARKGTTTPPTTKTPPAAAAQQLQLLSAPLSSLSVLSVSPFSSLRGEPRHLEEGAGSGGSGRVLRRAQAPLRRGRASECFSLSLSLSGTRGAPLRAPNVL